MAAEQKREWFLDSGCSNHMTLDLSLFFQIDDSVKVKIKLGNGDLVEVRGKGTVDLETKVEKTQTLRSDRGTDFNSKKFDKFCKNEGLEHQLTVAYTPQQNGVSERKTRTVMEMARSMLMAKGLHKKFWAEAVHTALYLLNRCPTKAVKNLTPIEAWSGIKPTAVHLKVFGCICYMHIPEQKRHKLEEKSTKGVFLGYSSQSKGYGVFNLKSQQLVTSKEKDEKLTQPLTIPVIESPETRMENDDDSQPATPTSEQRVDSNLEFSDQSTPETTPRRMRPLSEIYESCNYMSLEPESFAVTVKESVWVDVMKKEIKMIEKNNTWELVPCHDSKKIIGVKWIYKRKLNPDCSLKKCKARLVAKGYSQQAGIDFNETYAPVARLDTIRTVCALATQRSWKISQLDVK